VFTGEFERSLDEKSRLTIPAEFRPGLGDDVFVTRGPRSTSSSLFPHAAWQELNGTLRQKSISAQTARYFNAGSRQKTDSQHRIGIPLGLRRHARLEPGNSAVVIGASDHLEIWSRDLWEGLTDQLVESGEMVSELREVGL